MTAALNWKHLDFSRPEEADWIRQHSGIPESYAEALLEDDTRPRVVQHESGILVLLRGVNLNPGAEIEDMIAIRVWIEDDRVISTSRRPLRSIETIANEAESGSGLCVPGDFLVRLSDLLVEFIAETVDQIEDSLHEAESSEDSRGAIVKHSPFSRIRRQTTRIRRYLAPQRDALDRLSKMTDSTFSTDHLNEFREQAHRLTLILENLDLVRERAMIAQEELLAVIAHEQNTRMLLLSIVAVIFLPLSFVTGLMGMNVAGLPGMVYQGSFWILAVIMLLITAFILVALKRKDWI
jgi:zinc transporter